ncbi:MAG: helix-turn-helix domain-containing protein [Clostridiales bacterium]|nr:helix-turn-helix domain-containing protein [Clostridiales bacterium]
MRHRIQELGESNIIGKKVTERRNELNIKQKDLLAMLQVKGIDINSSSLSKLEGQVRSVSDYELKAIAEVLEIDVKDLLN